MAAEEGFDERNRIKSVGDTGIRPIVIEEIRNFARKNGIKKVVLFGSRARGDHWRASDIDLAVWGGDIQTFAFDVDEETINAPEI